MPVVCHAHDLGNETYWIAANACDRIWLSPAGSLETVGIAAQVLYAKRLLAELRIDVDMLQVGKFKGAVEPFTHDGPSDEARASLMQMLTSVRHQWLEGIEQARTGASPQMELGPYSPKEAKDKGLVDAVGMASEAREEAKTRANVSQAVVRFGPGAKTVDTSGIAELVRALSGAGGATDEPHVAVLRATGAIAATSSGALFSDGDGISERQLTQSLFQVGKDEAVRAVVLRIDSPGGSALASDLLWHQLMQLRKIKPLIVSIGDMAASGGYYLACAGTRVFAESSSIIGSIGVVGGKLAIGRGLDHLGVSAEVFPASDAQEARARAAYLSPFVAWDEASRVRALKTMQSVYELFVERVAEGRHLEPQRIAAFAEGRIFAAREGLELGMVDEIGGLQDAIAYALRVGGLEPTGAVRWVEQGSGLEKLLQLDPEDDVSAATGPMARNWVLRPILASTSSVEWLPYAEAWAPWIQGERMLVAVPFAILIR